MPQKEFHYQWTYELDSSPEQLWPLIANTDRFNRDVGLPALQQGNAAERLPNARKRTGIRKLGLKIEWEEEPFEWVRFNRFGVRRAYFKGPVSEMRVLVELVPRAGKGTTVNYQVWIVPRNWVGRAAIPFQIGTLSARSFAAAIKQYDEIAVRGKLPPFESVNPNFVPGGKERLKQFEVQLSKQITDARIVELVNNTIATSDDVYASRIRPYELADHAELDRKSVLTAFLTATRIGMFDLQWDVLCPHCRGAKESHSELSGVEANAYCATCNIDFIADFHRTIELTFRVAASIRNVTEQSFCLGSPALSPHIIVQQLVSSGTTRRLNIPLDGGRYRLRALELPESIWIEASEDGEKLATFIASADGWNLPEAQICMRPALFFENQTGEDQLFILERTSWNEHAVTAAEVTSLQVFRDLFATEALRPGEMISVGTLTVAFTDLRGSTQLYRAIGDAPAFGRVMSHFDVLREVIAEEEGALVKTIGDAVMAVFRRPVNAVRAMSKAQCRLAERFSGESAIYLKAGINTGPCIAVTLNDRLDYFGGTINMAARLEGLSSGIDIIISDAVMADPEVESLVSAKNGNFVSTRFSMRLKGFEDENFELWRVNTCKPI